MKPTMELRWIFAQETLPYKGPPPKLQQKWIEVLSTAHSEGLRPPRIIETPTGKFEWRDIPSVMEGFKDEN